MLGDEQMIDGVLRNAAVWLNVDTVDTFMFMFTLKFLLLSITRKRCGQIKDKDPVHLKEVVLV